MQGLAPQYKKGEQIIDVEKAIQASRSQEEAELQKMQIALDSSEIELDEFIISTIDLANYQELLEQVGAIRKATCTDPRLANADFTS